MDPAASGAAATLTYCTNVHPGANLAEVERSLDEYTVAVARRFRPDGPFPVGLYVSAATAAELAAPDRLARFAEFLAERRLAVATFNCYPYGGFHRESVKLAVYQPSWIDAARVEFTLQAARAAAALAPLGSCVPISTLGGGCKLSGDGPEVHRAMAKNLATTAAGLERIAEETGREVVLCLEPEPFTTLETTAEAIRFFAGPLQSRAARTAYVAAGGVAARADAVLRRHLALCYDCCHQAVEYEEPAAAIGALRAGGIRIGKLQLSSALAARAGGDRAKQLAALRRFVEPRWLHQSLLRTGDGAIVRHLDLDSALQPFAAADRGAELRVHYHVPIDCDDVDGLATTRADWIAAARAAVRLGATGCFEVETYTLPTLPAGSGAKELIEALVVELGAADQVLRAAESPS